MRNIFSLLIIICYISYHSAAHAQGMEAKEEILFITSYNYESNFVYKHTNSFITNYSNLHGKCSSVVEQLNCQSLDDRNRWNDAFKTALNKHPNAKFIVLMGPETWICYFSLTEEKYKKMPIACIMGQRYGATFTDNNIPTLQVADTDAEGITDLRKMMQGFNVQYLRYYEYDTETNYSLIRHLFPDTENIVIISDNTYLGLSEMRLVKHTLEKNHPDVNLLYIDGSRMNLEEALQTMASLPPRTAAILCIWRFDRNNVAYLNNADYHFEKANSKVPVFSLTGTSIGYGYCIGGCIPQYVDNIGETLAEHVYRTIDRKEQMLDNHLQFTNEYRFDRNVMNRFKIDEGLLPSESILLNATTDWKQFIETNKWYIILVSLFVLSLVVGLLVSIRYSLHIRHLKNRLEEEKICLESSENELREAKERAEEGSRMKSSFISNMSHEIRTPLNAIVGFAGILEEETKGNEDLKEFVNIINYNSELLLKLINDILDLSRLESGRQSFSFQEENLVEHCTNIVAGLQATAAKGVQMSFRHSTPQVMAETDITRLQQVLINLIGNAAKFTKQGSITLEVSPDDEAGQWVFSLTDTGCGIPPEKQQAVFERFEKLNEYAQGTGLGLSICQITIEKLGGRIWIDSGYTQGARFMFTLPYKHV